MDQGTAFTPLLSSFLLYILILKLHDINPINCYFIESFPSVYMYFNDFSALKPYLVLTTRTARLYKFDITTLSMQRNA